MTAIHIENYNGFRIEIFHDPDPINPRTEYDNGGTMLCLHGRYSLGDEHSYTTPEQIANAVIQSVNSDADDFDDLEKAEAAFDDLPVTVLPLYLYDHSGITMSTKPFHCPWDSGRVGLIYITDERAASFYGYDQNAPDFKEKVTAALIAEVDEYDNYLTGSAYGYRVFSRDENDDEEVDSCWGFLGDMDYCIQQAKENVCDG